MDSNLNEFTRKFIKAGRDKSLAGWDGIIEGRIVLPKFQDYQSQISSFTNEEQLLMKKLGRDLVDSCMHNLLFLFETERFETDIRFSINIKMEDGQLKNLTDLLEDPLQGYIFDWIEDYSDK
jgi:hypothetical protein